MICPHQLSTIIGERKPVRRFLFGFSGLNGINLDIDSNNLYAVVGPVGSSKTTLLQTILGELDLDDGSLTINGTVCYASQEPWIFEGTIKQNILFTELYDEDR